MTGKNKRPWAKALAVILIVALAGGIFWAHSAQDAPSAPQGEILPEGMDVNDSWEMHSAQLPTKGDVIQWHLTGTWGYSRVEDGARVTRTWDELPGGSEYWDGVYGIDHESAAHVYK